jgi:hypothetical protein
MVEIETAKGLILLAGTVCLFAGFLLGIMAAKHGG